MIGRKAHPDDPTQCVFVPLTYDRHSGECVPIMGPEGSHANELLAARVCLGDWLTQYWLKIRRVTRRLRAFCDHPNFADFEADGIDAQMIKGSARQLAEVVELGAPNISRLFDAPTDDDRVRFGDMVYELDPETRFLIAAHPIEDDAETQSPDTLLARYIRMSVRKVSDLLQHPISRRGLENAIDHLILMLPPDDDEPESTEREPSQFIADHRSARHLLTAIVKAEERTGRQVGIRGLEAMIAALQRLIERYGGENDNQASDEVTSEYPRPEVDGVVLREIDDDPPADDPEAGNGGGRGDQEAEKPDASDDRGNGTSSRARRAMSRPGSRRRPGDPGKGKKGPGNNDEGGNNGTQ